MKARNKVKDLNYIKAKPGLRLPQPPDQNQICKHLRKYEDYVTGEIRCLACNSVT